MSHKAEYNTHLPTLCYGCVSGVVQGVAGGDEPHGALPHRAHRCPPLYTPCYTRPCHVV